jgi:KaiC/GvpD/RAD55 family RecA-like ATPase
VLRVSKFHSRTGRLGQPLDSPYQVFDFEDVKFRYGATSMIAGKPGSFKSILALNLVVRWTAMGHDVLYFSADSDEYTVARRLAGIMTGANTWDVETDFAQSKMGRYLPSLRSLDQLALWEYRSMEIEQIKERLDTYEDANGGYPDVVFIDNLINYAPSTDDWGAMRDMTNGFDMIARETKSHICILHHASEADTYVYDAALGKSRPRRTADPVPRSAIQGKVTQIPRLVLTTASNGDQMAVACVKNTNGRQYPDADHFMQMEVHDNLRITDNYKAAL